MEFYYDIIVIGAGHAGSAGRPGGISAQGDAQTRHEEKLAVASGRFVSGWSGRCIRRNRSVWTAWWYR